MSFNWNQLPLLKVLLPFIFGLLIARFWVEYNSIHVFSFIGSLCSVFLVLLLIDRVYFSKAWSKRYIFALFIQVFIIGLAILYSVQNQKIKQQVYIPDDRELVWVGEVLDVQEKIAKQTLLVHLKQLIEESERKNLSSKVIVYLNDSIKINVGDELIASTYFKEFSEPLNPAQFNFKEYNHNKYRYYFAFEDHVKILNHKQSINSHAAAFREQIEQGFIKMGIGGDELAVLKALTLGDKSEINPELKSKFADAGAMHILAVSGLHVGIIFLILNQLLSFLSKRSIQRWLKAILLLAGIWAFALLTGFSPSVQRASWMFSFIILATALNRDTNVINSLAASALLLLLIDPNVLFEVGFQLSYSAVLGIVLIYPKIYPLFKTRNKWINKVIGLFVVSFAAQLATMPLSIYYFHQFPNWFLVTNLFAIPLAFVIVSGGFIVSVFWLFLERDFYLGELLNKALELLNYLVNWSSFLPYPATTGIWFQSTSIVLFYFSVAFFIAFLYFNRKRTLLICLSLIITAFSTELLEDLRQLKKKHVGFYALKSEVISVVNGLDAAVFVNDSSIEYYDRITVEQHLQSIGINNTSWKFNRSQSINHTLFKYLKADSFEKLTAFNHSINFIENENDLVSADANIIYLKKGAPIERIDKQKLNQSIQLIFSPKIPSWSKTHVEFSDLLPVFFLNRDGYVELNFNEE